MRILYVVHGYKPAYRLGGPILSVSATAEALVDRGHSVTVFTTNSNLNEDLDVPVNQPVKVNGVEVWYFERTEPLQRFLPFVKYFSQSIGFLYAPKLKNVLREKIDEFDIVHTHMPFVYPTLAAGRIAIKNGKPLFYHQRGVYDPSRLNFRGLKKRLYISLFERPVMRKANTLIALTEAEAKSFRDLGIQTKCRVIPNGIDLGQYSIIPDDHFEKKFPVRPDHKVILFLSRVHPIKGADILLEAFLKIGRDIPSAILVMAGPDEFGLKFRFKQRVGEAGMEDRVLFPGMVTGNFKRNLLARADLFCLPSVAEGFSMAILEAMASGTAVLLSPGCHFPEIDVYQAGKTVELRSRRWSEALRNALIEPQKLQDMGQRARRLVEINYNWKNIVCQLEEAYFQCLGRV